MIKVIFFDFDGTISDAKSIAYNSMIRALEDFGYNLDGEKLRKLMGTKMHLILKELGLGTSEVQKVRTRFYKYFIKAAVGGGIRPCVSLNPLWEMKKGGMPLVVISNSKTSFLRASIKTLKIKGLFKRIYGSEKFKAKDDLLRELFKKFKIKPSEAIYVGDRFSDVEFARDAGCVAVAIHNRCSWSTLKLIKKEKPDYIIKDFRGLRKIVNGID
jgi:phosphoglycolate phosphatase-like HAD superfamily hydrolase